MEEDNLEIGFEIERDSVGVIKCCGSGLLMQRYLPINSSCAWTYHTIFSIDIPFGQSPSYWHKIA